MDQARIRKSALTALKALKAISGVESLDLEKNLKVAISNVEFIAENSKRKRTERDRARERRRSRKGIDPEKLARMRAEMEKHK